jgi:sterol desaturase/sphingolipid hydroxylase (fatty acid hydroxylase superfamily)
MRYEINHEKEPIRLFESQFLEVFTHIHPAVVLAIWVPVVALLLAVSVLRGTGWLVVVAGVALGLALWTLAEYMLHRFVFHFEPRAPWQERISYLAHGIHHHQPRSKTRLVMPPAVSIPLALLFFGLFWVVFSLILGLSLWLLPTFAGFLTGYIIYDMIHYATHHFPMRSGAAKWIKQHHMRHHYKNPDLWYGVSSPLWDVVFGTMKGR